MTAREDALSQAEACASDALRAAPDAATSAVVKQLEAIRLTMVALAPKEVQFLPGAFLPLDQAEALAAQEVVPEP